MRGSTLLEGPPTRVSRGPSLDHPVGRDRFDNDIDSPTPFEDGGVLGHRLDPQVPTTPHLPPSGIRRSRAEVTLGVGHADGRRGRQGWSRGAPKEVLCLRLLDPTSTYEGGHPKRQSYLPFQFQSHLRHPETPTRECYPPYRRRATKSTKSRSPKTPLRNRAPSGQPHSSDPEPLSSDARVLVVVDPRVSA